MSERPDRPPAEEVPRPEPAERPDEPVVGEPRESEPIAEPLAPIQMAPDPGTAPSMAEPAAPSETPPSEPAEPAAASEPAEPSAPDAAASEAGPEDREAAPEAPAETGRAEEPRALPPTTTFAPPSPQGRMPALEGVAVPFAAPPTERSSGKFAATLVIGIGGGVAVIAAVVVALVVSLLTLADSLMEKIETTAEAFVSDVADERWDDAYDRLCPELREQPVADYIDEWESWKAEGGEARQVRDEMNGTYVSVELDDGSTVELRMIIDQESTTIDPFVCGWRHTDG